MNLGSLKEQEVVFGTEIKIVQFPLVRIFRLIKALTKQEGPKMMSFSQLPAVKKTMSFLAKKILKKLLTLF